MKLHGIPMLYRMRMTSQIPGPMMDRYARQIPIVVVGHHEPLAESFDTVNSDDRTGAQMAVQALDAKGYSDIAMLAMEWDARHQADVSPQREQGYFAVMQDPGFRTTPASCASRSPTLIPRGSF